MRVLRINDYMGEPGGAEAYISQISKLLTTRGHPQKIFTISNVQTLIEYTPLPWEEVYPLRPLGVRRLFEDVVGEPGILEHLKKVAQEFRPDLVHLHHFDNMFTPVADFLQSLNVPVVMTAHDAKLFCPLSTLTLPNGDDCEGGILPRCQFTGCNVGRSLPYRIHQINRLMHDVQPHIRAFLAPSLSTTALLDRFGFRPAHRVPSFIREPDTLPPLSNAEPRGPPVVGILTRLHFHKGAQTVLEAFVRVQKEIPNARLVIAGRGPYENALKKRAEELHIEGAVEFPGWIEGAAKEEFFHRIHVLAVPSIAYENFPLVSLEAMARCKSVLGSRNGGIPDLVLNDETGRLLPPNDMEAWAQAMLEVLRDPQRLQKWGTAGRKRYEERFRPQNHLEGLLNVYSSVLKQGEAS
ncbi:MAG: glycosyltransferase [Candidatus Thermoplasmatota archaeon]|nr:glycosyltransferase [Candidatus Thermoplasmatota archaeon]